MCGIVGVAGPSIDDADLPAIERALDTLDHRGPDARSMRRVEGRTTASVLGHTRLRIIDLSSDADQPMPNEDETVWLLYNGELYDEPRLRRSLEERGHRFRSRSDTEVLVHLYEEHADDPIAMLPRLRGMFAFAIVDTTRDRVFIARDRLGIKPVYWIERHGGIAWASEVAALAAAGCAARRIEREDIADFLFWGHTAGATTMASGVHEMPPGHALVFEDGHVDVRRWFEPAPAPDGLVGEDAVRLVRATLRDVVRRHLVADRPAGVFLSGGVDSTAVVASAVGDGEVRTFTVAFPDAPDDESAQAAEIAARYGATHEQVPVTGPDVASVVSDVVESMDRPTADGVNSWLVSRAARQGGLVVALSGLGGDELFGGYPSFKQVPRLTHAAGWLGPVGWRQGLAAQAAQRSPGGRAARVLDAVPGYEGAYAAVRGQFSAVELRSWGMVGRFDRAVRGDGRSAAPGDRVMLLEMANYMPEQLLLDTDQMSMAHSLEVRVPLLDDVLVRVALALPAAVRLRAGKALLAEAANVRLARKRPFALPFDPWLRGPLRAFLREGLLSSSLPMADEIPEAFRRELLAAFDERRTHWSRPWSVAVLRTWAALHGASVG
jgi:asparagine synthase (glutamine-hydrolysing)